MAKLDSGAMTIGNNDNWREIFDDQNATAQAANQATADLAPIINGKRCALSVASGGFVLLRNSTITGKADGAYTAAKAIPANTDLDGSYLTAISGGVANALNGKIVNLDSVFRTPEDHQITRIGTYFTERSAFKARRMGNLVNIYSYVNITTQVPSGTQFADTGFSTASGVLLFCQGDGTQPTVVRCEGGKLLPDSAIATGYYYVIGALSAYIP